MIKKRIIVHLQQGLQARSATEFVQKASSFNSEIKMDKNGMLVECKSIMGVMATAIKKGEALTLIVNGNDEQKAIVALEDFLSNKE